MKFILIIFLSITGLGIGVGAGAYLKPESDSASAEPTSKMAAKNPEEEGGGSVDYVKLNNQFVVPIVSNGSVSSLVVLSLSLEITTGNTEEVYEKEPKIRDSFLQVLFDHANAGGFSGTFTQSTNMVVLRDSLLETAKKVIGNFVHDVLIVDMIRQDT